MQVGSDLVAVRQNRHKMGKKRFFMSKQNTKLVIEEDTVYEVDLSCMRNRRRKRQQKNVKKGKKRT